MLIDELGRHIAIGNRERAEDLVSGDRDFWNVISLLDPNGRRFPVSNGAKSVHTEVFRDVEDESEPFIATDSHIERIFAHIDSLEIFDPILIHCSQGLSRSPAVALSIIARSLHLDGEPDPVPAAIEILLRLHKIAAPNLLVVRRAFELFLPTGEVDRGWRLVRDDPRFSGNRFQRW